MSPSNIGPSERFCDIESTSLTLIQRRKNVVCPIGTDNEIVTRTSEQIFLNIRPSEHRTF